LNTDWVGLKANWRRSTPATREIHAMAAPAAHPRRENHRALIFFDVHVKIMSQLPKNRKPTVGFSACFFVIAPFRANG
jgi:hypothetical protein